MCVGFLDLVGSTALAQRLTTRELGTVLTEFEHVAADHVTSAGGRIVKLIGDEVLYTASNEAAACRIALNLASTFAAHRTVPNVRAGVAAPKAVATAADIQVRGAGHNEPAKKLQHRERLDDHRGPLIPVRFRGRSRVLAGDHRSRVRRDRRERPWRRSGQGGRARQAPSRGRR
jgi:hypothetical protein